MAEKILYGPQDRFHPFSNGTEHRMWLSANCHRGEGGCRRYRPDASSSRDGCPIEVAIAKAACLDGTISMKHALRGGFVELGPNGLFRDRTVGVASDGLPCGVIVACPEYKGYDEPEDRPRRGPSPRGTLDLLDPRNASDRTRVRA